jgi:exopolysaccharide biosynthesis operon protein EpsL
MPLNRAFIKDMKLNTYPPLLLHPRGNALLRIKRNASHLASAAAVVAATLLICNPALAFDDDALNIGVSASERYDSNLFLLPNGLQPPQGNGQRSAYTRTAGVDLRIEKSYGQQRFDLGGNVSHEYYSPYSSLDFTSHVLNAAWAWTLTPSLTGNLSINITKVPNSFGDTGFQTQANPRTTEDKRFDVNYRPGASLHPRFSVVQSEDKSAQTTIDRDNSRTSSVEGAMVYEFHSGNSADVYFRRGKGNYFDNISDASIGTESEFNEHETGVSAHWTEGAAQLDGKVGYLTREHRTFSERNFAGPVGQITFAYAVTGKTQILLAASSSLSSAQSLISNYSQDQTISITPIWSATGKITVRPSYTLTHRSFKGATTPGVDSLRWTTRDAALEVDWSALRSLNFVVTINHSNRTSNDPTFQYSNRGALVSGKWSF